MKRAVYSYCSWKQKGRWAMTKEIQIREVRIGSGQPKICVPMTGKDRSALLEEAGRIRDIKADLAEWRADFYEGLSHEESLPDMLREIRNALGEIPLILPSALFQKAEMRKFLKRNMKIYTDSSRKRKCRPDRYRVFFS